MNSASALPPRPVLAALAGARTSPTLLPLPHAHLLHPWQHRAASGALQRLIAFNTCLLAHPVGSGKSFIALAAAAAHFDLTPSLPPPLIVCPSPLIPQWRDLLSRFTLDFPIVSHATLSRRAPPATSLIIVDEAHHFRNPTTKRHRSLRSLSPTPALLLSATPIWNSPADLSTLLSLSLPSDTAAQLTPHPTSSPLSHPALAERLILSDVSSSPRSRLHTTLTPPGPPLTLAHSVLAAARGAMLYDEPGELFQVLVARRLASSPAAAIATLSRAASFLHLACDAHAHNRSISRRDVLRAFPSNTHAQTILPLWFDPSPPPFDPRPALSALLTAQSNLSSLPPVSPAKLQATLSVPRPVIVFTEYTATAVALTQSLPHSLSPLCISAANTFSPTLGSLTIPQALHILEHGSPLLRHPPQVAVLTPLGAEGLNLQFAESVVHFDLPWNPARLEQRTGRVDRPRTPSTPVHVLTIHPSPTLESAFHGKHTLRAKRAHVEHFLALTQSSLPLPAVDSPPPVVATAVDHLGPVAVVLLAGPVHSRAWQLVHARWQRSPLAATLARFDWPRASQASPSDLRLGILRYPYRLPINAEARDRWLRNQVRRAAATLPPLRQEDDPRLHVLGPDPLAPHIVPALLGFTAPALPLEDCSANAPVE